MTFYEVLILRSLQLVMRMPVVEEVGGSWAPRHRGKLNVRQRALKKSSGCDTLDSLSIITIVLYCISA